MIVPFDEVKLRVPVTKLPFATVLDVIVKLAESMFTMVPSFVYRLATVGPLNVTVFPVPVGILGSKPNTIPTGKKFGFYLPFEHPAGWCRKGWGLEERRDLRMRWRG